MRIGSCAGALLTILTLVVPVGAQSSSVYKGGFNPQSIVNRPIDTSKAVAPVIIPQAKKPFSISDLVPSFLKPGPSVPKAPSAPRGASPFQPAPPMVRTP